MASLPSRDLAPTLTGGAARVIRHHVVVSASYLCNKRQYYGKTVILSYRLYATGRQWRASAWVRDLGRFQRVEEERDLAPQLVRAGEQPADQPRCLCLVDQQ